MLIALALGLVLLAMMVLVALLVVFIIFYWGPREIKRERTKPVVCVCEEHGRVGVVLRRDYDAASKAEWQPYIDGGKDHDPGHVSAPFGRRIRVEPVYVFSKYSKEYFTLMYYCFVERAEFHVPEVRSEDMNNIDAACRHIHGKQWSGNLIDW